MKKILCPTDFSDSAQNAIAYAAKLAQITEARLVLFNVQSLFDLAPEEIVIGKAMTIESVSNSLETQSLEVSRAFKISCYAEVQPSSVSLAKTIADKAAGYDLIVMGTNGPDDIYQNNTVLAIAINRVLGIITIWLAVFFANRYRKLVEDEEVQKRYIGPHRHCNRVP